MSLKQDLDKLESLIPEEFKTVVTKNTMAAEKQFIKEMNELNNHIGNNNQMTSMHVSWGPNAKNMTKEELVKYLWEVENSPKTQVLPGEIDGKS